MMRVSLPCSSSSSFISHLKEDNKKVRIRETCSLFFVFLVKYLIDMWPGTPGPVSWPAHWPIIVRRKSCALPFFFVLLFELKTTIENEKQHNILCGQFLLYVYFRLQRRHDVPLFLHER